MRRILALLLTVFALSLGACGTPSQEPPKQPASQQQNPIAFFDGFHANAQGSPKLTLRRESMFQSAFSIPTCSDSLNLSDFISIGGVLLIGKRSRIAEKNATVSIPVLRGSFRPRQHRLQIFSG